MGNVGFVVACLVLVLFMSGGVEAFELGDFFKEVREFFTGKVVEEVEPVPIDDGSGVGSVPVPIDDGLEVEPVPILDVEPDFDNPLFDREGIVVIDCESSWSCSEWEACGDDEISRRTCVDSKRCDFQISKPSETRVCESSCEEEWICEWSSCVDGLIVPDCVEISDCGTFENLPGKLACDSSLDLECVPEVECSEWTGCGVGYGFGGLDGGVDEFEGVSSRLCSDLNGCAESVKETRDCSVAVDIFPVSVQREDGVEQINIYDNLDGGLIARILKGDETNPLFNIELF